MYWKNRMKMVKETNRKAIQNELKKNVDLIENETLKQKMKVLKR